MALKDTHCPSEADGELSKAKLDNVIIPAKTQATESNKRSTMTLSRTMEDVARKYREIQLDEDSASVEEDDDDDLLNSDNDSRFGDFEAASDTAFDRAQQHSGSAGRDSVARPDQIASPVGQPGSDEENVADRGLSKDADESSVREWNSHVVNPNVKRVGRASDRASISSSASAWTPDNDYLRRLEADQEELSGSLLALTSHFAQVQLRLKQVKAAPPDEKERLLSELETLAFRGVPDLRVVYEEDCEADGGDTDVDGGTISESGSTARGEPDSEPGGRAQTAGSRRRRAGLLPQTELIEQLKAQLTDLEQLAYESGELPALPTAKRLHNQRVLMERLQQRLALRGDGLGSTAGVDAGAISNLLGDLERIPAEERDFDSLVERAVGAILNPVRLKEKVVEQLKTQIVDLERFIVFLQHGGAGQPPVDALDSDTHAPGCPAAATYSASSRAGSSSRLPSPPTCACGLNSATASRRGKSKLGANDNNGLPFEINLHGRATDRDAAQLPSAPETAGRSRVRRVDPYADHDSDDLIASNGSRGGRTNRTVAGQQSQTRPASAINSDTPRQTRSGARTRDEHAEASAARGMLKRIAALVHIFVLTNLACMKRERLPHSSSANFAAAHVNTVKEHHYGQSLARLQVLVDRVCQIASASSDRTSSAVPPSTRTRASPAPTSNKARNAEPQTRGRSNDEQAMLNNAKLQLCASDATAATTVAVPPPQDAEVTPDGDASMAYASDDDECYLAANEHALTALIRKQLLPVVRDLLEHGLRNTRTARAPAVASCFSSASYASSARAPTSAAPTSAQARRLSAAAGEPRGPTAWQLFARYYEMKGGRQWNAQPARNLSAAFAIDVVGGRSVSAKQTLLAAIDRVLALHSKFKRSDDAKLKALFCLALNERHIVAWLRLIVHNQSVVDEYYEPWSYVAITGFEDALRALTRLQAFTFRLPFDLAVRQLQNIKDAF